MICVSAEPPQSRRVWFGWGRPQQTLHFNHFSPHRSNHSIHHFQAATKLVLCTRLHISCTVNGSSLHKPHIFRLFSPFVIFQEKGEKHTFSKHEGKDERQNMAGWKWDKRISFPLQKGTLCCKHACYPPAFKQRKPRKCNLQLHL